MFLSALALFFIIEPRLVYALSITDQTKNHCQTYISKTLSGPAKNFGTSLAARHRYEGVQKFREAFNKGEFKANERYIVIRPERREEVNTGELIVILEITDQSIIAETIEDKALVSPFPRGNKRELNRKELNLASLFPKPSPYTLEEIPEAIVRFNRNFPETEQIVSRSTYRKFYYKDPRFPPWKTLENWYAKKYGTRKGCTHFVFTGQQFIPKPPPYTLEEIPEAIARLNRNSPETEQITNGRSYGIFRYKDPRLPSWRTLENWYEQKYGTIQGCSYFIFTGRQFIPKPPPYDLEEIPEAVERVNRKSPETEQMTSRPTYREFRYKDIRLPPWKTLENWYEKKYGTIKGCSQFVFKGQQFTPKPPPYDLEEIPKAVERVNRKSPETEQMTSRPTYREFRYKDIRLPPWKTLENWYEKKYGTIKGCSQFVFKGIVPLKQ